MSKPENKWRQGRGEDPNPAHELAGFTLWLINNSYVMGNLFLAPCSYKVFFLTLFSS